MTMNVALIGGAGNMGKLVNHLLSKHGFVVWPIGRKSPDFDERIKQSDIVMFSVPIFAFDETIKNIKHLDLKDKLLVDLSSGVSGHIKKMQKLSSHSAFIHLMFGPDIYDIKNQNIIVSDKVSDARFAKLVDVFKKEGARITASSPEHHDYMMAIVQALSQFNTISLAKTISGTTTSPKELHDFSSITFSLNTEIISRIVGQDSQLWAGIQFNNAFFSKILKEHIKNLKMLAKYVDTKDYEKFRVMFEGMSRFWRKDLEGEKQEKQIEFLEKETVRKNKMQKNFSDAIGILGPEGSYSQQASIQYNAHTKPVFFDSIIEIIEALDSREIAQAILPFENSIQGTVLETLDGIYHADLKINNEVIVNVDHVIAGLDRKIPTKEIKFIYSHPQALGQCNGYIREHYPHAKLILTPSTSAAFKKIKDEGLMNTLAIGSRLAANIYGLSIVSDNIQDVKNNQTLFVVVTKRSTEGKIEQQTQKILPFTFFVIDPTRDVPGLLHDILGIFKEKSINMLKLESRPSRERLGSYIFYLKAQITSDDTIHGQVVAELKKFGSVKLLT